MKLIEVIKREKPGLSFEVFPPKTWDKLDSVIATTEKIAKLEPTYMSVTYGAGGGTSDYTVKIAKNLKDNCKIEPLAHLTCVSSSRERVHSQLDLLKDAGIENLLALRGDLVAGMDMNNLEYRYASQLIYDIKDYMGDAFCIGGACYPEGHPECPSITEDIRHLKEKVDAGCEFLTTQMFFENHLLYRFLDRIEGAGITAPVVAGIMPVTNPNTIKRTMMISGTEMPRRIIEMVEKYENDPDDLKSAGIEYATEQIIDLYEHGVNAVHVYCMNKPDVAERIKSNVSEYLK